jgi:hypothetical protein
MGIVCLASLEKARKSYKQTVDETIYTTLRTKVFSSSMHVHAPVATIFTAANSINLLADSLMSLQHSQLGDKGAEQRE